MMIGARVLNQPGNDEIGRVMVHLADKAKVPIVVFLDHSSDFATCMKAMRLGFSAVMIDGSALPFEENIVLTQKIAEAAYSLGVSVEGELGALAGLEDGAESSLMLTNPKDIPLFTNRTGVDALAISIGNAHGLYHGIPHLHFEVLNDSAKLTDTPLVLHGGTGLSRKQFAQAVDLSVRKINIGTEIKRAYMDTFMKLHSANTRSYDLIGVPQQVKKAVARTVQEYLDFFADGWSKELQ
jgi:fructose-bisphosphate aldolase class II